MAQQTHQAKLSSTQAGGAVSVGLTPTALRPAWNHSIQAEVTLTADGSAATATAGTLSVRGRITGAATFQELGTIDLTAPDPVVFDGLYTAIEAESTGLDADKTWTLYIADGG